MQGRGTSNFLLTSGLLAFWEAGGLSRERDEFVGFADGGLRGRLCLGGPLRGICFEITGWGLGIGVYV